MSKQIWLSVMHWPKGKVSLGNVDNASIDSHDNKEMAEAIVAELKKKGFGCKGEIFPLKGYVILEEDHKFLKMYRANKATAEAEGWGLKLDDGEQPELHACGSEEDFDADASVWTLVSDKAEAGSELHQEVMLYLQRNNPKQFAEIAEIVQIGGAF